MNRSPASRLVSLRSRILEPWLFRRIITGSCLIAAIAPQTAPIAIAIVLVALIDRREFMEGTATGEAGRVSGTSGFRKTDRE